MKVNTILNTTGQKWPSVTAESHCNVFGMRKNIDLVVNEIDAYGPF